MSDDRAEMQERRQHGLKARHETRVERAIRRQVAEEIAQALDAENDLLRSLPVNDPGVNQQSRLVIPARASAFRDAAKIARDIGAKETS